MLKIAGAGSDITMNLLHISEDQNIPHNYLEQIFIKLKKEGLVASIRGPGGGYKLIANPAEISIYSIIKAVEDEIAVSRCSGDKECSANATKCSSHYLWDGLENKVVEYLSKISLADVINGKVQNLSLDSPPKEKIYLDFNATTPLHSDVIKEMQNICRPPENPSSVHWYGRKAKALIENARSRIATACGIKLGLGEYQITFTASGTEANNLLLHNFRDKNILLSETEHQSILATAKEYGNHIFIKVDIDGQIDMTSLKDACKNALPGSIVSIINANNETGVIQQNMEGIVKIVREHGLYIHGDAVQSFGKVETNISNLDFATISAHKIGGPVGAAALIHKTNISIKAQILGGGQERGVRSGTENVAAIVGFAKAADLIKTTMNKYRDIESLRDNMEKMLSPDASFYGKNTLRLPNTSMIMMPGIVSEKQLIQFDLNDISVSAGSACSSGKTKTSYVLLAMQVPEKDAQCAIRVSLGPDTTSEEVEKFVAIWQKIFKQERI